MSNVTSRHSSVSSEGAVKTLTSHDILPVSNSALFLLRGGILCWCATVLFPLADHTLFRAVGSTEAIARILARRLRSNRMEVVYKALAAGKLPPMDSPSELFCSWSTLVESVRYVDMSLLADRNENSENIIGRRLARSLKLVDHFRGC